MTVLGVVCALLLVALGLLLLRFAQQRRELETVAELNSQLERLLATQSAPGGRLHVAHDQLQVHALASSINLLLGRYANAAARPSLGPRLFFDLADRMHEIVIVHRDVLLFANLQFASLLGSERALLAGRSLEQLVTAEFTELVASNLKSRLAEQPAAERFEIEVADANDQVTRLEVSSVRIDYEGAPALLITGVEIVQTALLPALALPSYAEATTAEAASIDLQIAAMDETSHPPRYFQPQYAALDYEDSRRAPSNNAQAVTTVAPGNDRAGLLAAHLLTLESIVEAIVTTDAQARIEYMNPAAERLLGLSVDDAQGRRLDEIVGISDQGDRRALSDHVLQSLASGTAVNIGRRGLVLAHGSLTGNERSIEVSSSPMRTPEGRIVGAALLLHDVTEMRGAARQMSYQATHDALTGLVNRREFERRLEEAIATAQRGEATHIVCYLDLDRFKIVNDSSGHLAGDALLREVAKLLRDAVRDSDTVARVGGDEFALLLIGCPLDKARQIADDLCRNVAEYRFVWKDRVFQIGVSVGLVELGRESGTVEELLAAADSACYVAKKQSTGGSAVYSARDEALARQTGEIHWLQRLQNALRDERFELYYQPIVPTDPSVTEGPGVEVLVRLKDEDGKPLPPAEFLRAAERYRLMGSIDRWVVDNTLRLLAANAIDVPERRSVSINISAQTLGDTQFLEFVVECLDRTGVSPAQVCFEMTESAVISNMEHARRFVGVLHGMGCKFALDDFGSGVGSFSNLKNLPMDYLKIDGSFTRNLSRDTVNQAMVTAMIKLARTLNFKVIAEQIEDAAALEFARRMGVDYVQGYVIARPAPLKEAA